MGDRGCRRATPPSRLTPYHLPLHRGGLGAEMKLSARPTDEGVTADRLLPASAASCVMAGLSPSSAPVCALGHLPPWGKVWACAAGGGLGAEVKLSAQLTDKGVTADRLLPAFAASCVMTGLSPSSAPVCALGHLPPWGKAWACAAGGGLGAEMKLSAQLTDKGVTADRLLPASAASCVMTGLSPHPPQCAHWGTFPPGGRLGNHTQYSTIYRIKMQDGK